MTFLRRAQCVCSAAGRTHSPPVRVQEWMKANPSRRPDILPEFKPLKPQLPQPMPGDPEVPNDEEEEEAKKRKTVRRSAPARRQGRALTPCTARRAARQGGGPGQEGGGAWGGAEEGGAEARRGLKGVSSLLVLEAGFLWLEASASLQRAASMEHLMIRLLWALGRQMPPHRRGCQVCDSFVADITVGA